MAFAQIDAHTAAITIEEPALLRNGKFRGFEIFMLKGGSDTTNTWKSIANLSAEARTFQVRGLMSKTLYDFMVRGYVEPFGYSDNSTVESLITTLEGNIN